MKWLDTNAWVTLNRWYTEAAQTFPQVGLLLIRGKLVLHMKQNKLNQDITTGGVLPTVLREDVSLLPGRI
jgi:hypothetical protein